MIDYIYNYIVSYFKSNIDIHDTGIEIKDENTDIRNRCKNIFRIYIKLYRFCSEDEYGGEIRQNYWKERGFGYLNFLKNKDTNMINIVMWHDKTKKLLLNFSINSYQKLLNSGDSRKTFCLNVYNNCINEGDNKYDIYCLKFENEDKKEEFKDEFLYSMFNNSIVMNENINFGEEDKMRVDKISSKKKYSSVMKQLLQFNTYNKEGEIISFQKGWILETI